MDEKLKPCPFCGSDEVHIRVLRNEKYEEIGAQIECYGCLSIYGQAEACCQEELVEAWNRRAENG